MRRSEQEYVQTASNHITGIRYSERGRILTVKFYNNAIYQYLNVPIGAYEAMLAAPSHGAFLWDHIRGHYPFRPLGKECALFDNVSHKICPDLAKLDALDKQESNANRELRDGRISESEHLALLRVLSHKRDALIKRLEKQGYFETEAEDCYNTEEEQEYQESFLDKIWQVIEAGFKLFFMIFLLFFGLMAALMR